MGFGDFFKSVAGPVGAIGGSVIGGPIGSAIGGMIGGGIQDQFQAEQRQKQWEREYNTQKEFAQHGVRWRVEDAKAAGIHPLVALGASTSQYAPQAVGDSGSSFASSMANMGQDITRSIQSTRTEEERTMADLQLQSVKLDLEGKALDNQIRASKLREVNQVGPPMAGSQSFISGQGNSGLAISEKPMERTTSLKGRPEAEPGALPSIGWMKTETGVVPVPSKDVKERIEDNMPHEFSHYLRNNIMPNFGGGSKPPKSALPKGASDWEWSFTGQEYRPIYKGKGKSPYGRAQDWYDRNLRYPK